MKSAVLGMGVTGQSIARYLRARGEACCCFDEKGGEGMTADVQVGPFDRSLLASFDRVVVSPGIAWAHPVLQALREHEAQHGKPQLLSDLDLFADHYQGRLLAVTGTNGKTTVTHLLGVLLETLPGGVEVAGNIGQPMLDLLSERRLSPQVVLELSSFQLQRSRPPHPAWAVLLNLQPDHLDMHGSAEAYRQAKERLFLRQEAGDRALLPLDDGFDTLAETLTARGVRVLRFGDEAEADVGLREDELHWRGADGVRCRVSLSDLKVLGRHQQLNLAVAAQGAADHGVHEAVIREGLTSFRGLPHRLQWIGGCGGRDWYDDSKATNPAAAEAALRAFDAVVWICGGVTKGCDIMALLPDVRDRVRLAVVIGTDPEPFVALAGKAGVPWKVAVDMAQAVETVASAEAGLPVVLAPAAASFDQFSDYAARGDAFIRAVTEQGDG